MKKRYKKILIQRADKLGDVVFSLPAIEALHLKYPEAKIDFLTSPIAADLVEDHPLVENVLIYDEKKKGDWRRTVKGVKKGKYDLYVSLWNHPKMAWLGKMAHIPVRVGDSSNPSLKWLYNRRVKQHWMDFSKHQIEHNLDLLKGVGINDPAVISKLSVNSDAKIKIKDTLKKHLNPQRKTVVIFQGTGGTNFTIPDRAIHEFIDLVEKSENFNVILCGITPVENSLDARKLKSGLNLINRTSLKELVAVINEAHFYIGADTGFTHIASFLRRPLIFFSPIKPNPPSRWGPVSPFFEIVRQEYRCHHSGNERCLPGSCFRYVNGQTLYDLLGQLITKTNLHQSMSYKKQQREWLLNSVRVFLSSKTPNDAVNLRASVSKVKDKGLVVFQGTIDPYSIRSLVNLIRIVKKKNINVIQGPVPKWMIWFVRFYMGTICQYIKPIYIKQPLNHYVKVKDYLEIYRARWNKQ
jgi:ADP-heptose:LPS heptosyltransferase